jgi:hypothetical protein
MTDPQVRDQISALSAVVLPEVADAFAVLELTPWNGAPYHQDKPNSPMRLLAFAKGHGLITYLVLDACASRCARCGGVSVRSASRRPSRTRPAMIAPNAATVTRNVI